jgi:hypothetical protein
MEEALSCQLLAFSYCGSTAAAHVGTAALGCPAEQSSAGFPRRRLTAANFANRQSFNYNAQQIEEKHRRMGLLVEFDGDQMRCIGLVGGFDILNLCRPIFQIAAGFEIATELEIEDTELNLVIIFGVQRERFCAG